jgi:Protein of unknown function (DUF2711)
MAQRRLPCPDLFASCPYDGKILEYYSDTFEAVLVVFHPFIKALSIRSVQFAPATYPDRSQIVSHCVPVSWVEVASKAGLPSIASVDIGLRTRIRGLKAEFSNEEFANKIERLIQSSAPNVSSTGSRTSNCQIPKQPRVIATSSHRINRFSGRPIGIVTFPFSARQSVISMLSRRPTDLKVSSAHR